MATPSLSPFAQRTLLVLGVYTASVWAIILIAFIAWYPGQGSARSAIASVARATSCATAPASTSFALAQWAMPAPAGMTSSVRVCDLSFSGMPVVAGSSRHDDSDGFSWRIRSKDGHSWSDAWDLDGDAPEGESWFWFKDDGVAYVVRDPALVAEAKAATEPLERIGHEMGKVGGEMGKNGAKMGRIGGRMGAIGARLALIETKMSLSSASREERRAHSDELDELRNELRALQQTMEKEQREHADENERLQRKMSVLSAQHAEVLKDVRQKVREIATRARREGRAERPHAKA